VCSLVRLFLSPEGTWFFFRWQVPIKNLRAHALTSYPFFLLSDLQLRCPVCLRRCLFIMLSPLVPDSRSSPMCTRASHSFSPSSIPSLFFIAPAKRSLKRRSPFSLFFFSFSVFPKRNPHPPPPLQDHFYQLRGSFSVSSISPPDSSPQAFICVQIT